MRSSLIEVLDISTQDTLQLLLLQDQQVIETLSPHTAQKAFTDRIGPWGVVGRFEVLDATGFGNPSEGYAKLAIVIPDEVFRSHTIGGGLPQLLCGPCVGGRARHADVDH